MSYRYKESTSCPFCGSTNIVLTDHHYAEKAFDKAVSAGLAHLLGLGHHGTIAGDEYDKPYLCKNCGRTWVGDGYNPENLPEDQYLYNIIYQKLLQGKYAFSTLHEVRVFFNEVDSYIYGQEMNGFRKPHPSESSIISPIIRSHYHLLKAYACLAFCVNEIKSNNVHILHVDSMISSGLNETISAYKYHATGEVELCNNLLRYLSCSVFDNKTDIDLSYTYQKDSYILPIYYWKNIIQAVKDLKLSDYIEPSSAYDLIEFFLTKDLRLNLWLHEANALFYCWHISGRNDYKRADKIKAFSSYRDNFNIPPSEPMIFVRDTSFWGNYNQGIVITNKCLYYIEDNDEPTVVCCPWGFLKNVEFLKDSRAIAFTTKDDSVLFLDCDLLY